MTFGSLNTIGDERQLRFVRFLAHPREKVWAALADPDLRAGWFFAGALPTVVGGAVDLIDSDEGVSGTVLRVDPGRLLEFTWNSGDGPASVVRFELSDTFAGTRLILTHTISQGSPQDLLAGWHRIVLDDLPEFLDSGAVIEKPGRWETLREQHYVPMVAAALDVRVRPEQRSVTLVREVSGGVEAAYRAFTDPEVLAQWWWPHLPDTSYSVDPVVGGEWRIRSVATGIGVRGTFTTVTPPERLAFTFSWMSDGQGETLDVGTALDEVEVTLTALPSGAGTLVRVVHSSGGPLGLTEGVGQGWQDTLDRLADCAF